MITPIARSQKFILAVTLAFAWATADANVQSIQGLVASDLSGVWEAVVERADHPSAGVYQMRFVSPQEAWLVEAWSHSTADRPQFSGRLVSSEIKDGKVDLRFDVVQQLSEAEYMSIEIKGYGSKAGDQAWIAGEIIITRQNGKTKTERVFFENSIWARSIADASSIAGEAIRNACEQKLKKP